MRLHENKNIVFKEEIEASSTTTMMNLSSLSTISYVLFEPIKLNVLFPMSFIVSSSQVSRIILIPQVST
jgi:membrane-anchored protein YejM (alkaline phosphatase superfamily)